MHLHRFAAAAACAALAACGGSSSKHGPAPQPVVVSFTSPAAAVHTDRDAVPMQVFVAVPADRVELLRNGEPFAVLAPPYQFTFFTALEAEGRHAFVARARVGGAWKESAPLEVWIDRTAPAIAALEPADGGAFAPSESLRLAFDEPLDPASVTPFAFSASTDARGGLPVTAELDADGKAVTLRFGPLSSPDRLAVAVHPLALRDLAGHPVAGASWSWDVRSRWAHLGAGVTPGYPSSLAIDPGTREPFVAGAGTYRFSSGAWSDATAWFTSGPSTVNAVVEVAGGADAVWGVSWFETLRLWRRASGGGWVLVAETPLGDPSWTTGRPVLAVEPSGDVVVAWSEQRALATAAPASALHVRRWTGAWSVVADVQVGDAVAPLAAIDVASGPAGTFLAYYEDGLPRVGQVTAGALAPLAPTGAYGLVALASTADGLLLAGTDGVTGLAVKRWTGSAWTAQAAPASAASVAHPALVVDGAGRLVAAWREADGGVDVVRSARLASGAWSPLGVVNADAARSAWFPVLAVEPGGAPVIAWGEQSSGSPTIHVARLVD